MMGLFGAAHGLGGDFWSPLPKICNTNPTMMKLHTVIPYRKKSSNVATSRNPYIDWILIHNFYFFFFFYFS